MSELDQIRKALKKAKLPAWVESTRVEAMVDHTGESAVRVTVVVRAGDEGIVNDGAALNALSRQIHIAIDAAGVSLFPYTRFVGANEAAA
jgi:hypothetical protein